jgi:hypothetical protein
MEFHRLHGTPLALINLLITFTHVGMVFPVQRQHDFEGVRQWRF